jgi:sortase (surface protein transpeptidase)
VLRLRPVLSGSSAFARAVAALPLLSSLRLGVRRTLLALLSAVLALPTLLLSPAVTARAHVPDYPVPEGHFFTQTAASGDESLLGFTVSNSGAVPLWSEYTRLGGIRTLGYPASQRFIWNGWVAQVVQRGILVWHPERGRAELANVMDDLSAAGYDDWLRTAQSIPAPFDVHEEAGLDFDAIKARRLRFLDGNPQVKQRFLGERNWEDLYGLPVSFDESDQAWVLRTQRAALQYWKVDVPWARKGTVTVAQGGDLAKEAGLLPADALSPEYPTVFRSAQPEVPVRLTIPKLKVDAPIVAFGLDQLEKDGSLPAPKRANDVAWYDYSGRAGEANNAVFAGHVDWNGASAVFARIKELVNGDQVVLTGAGGTRFTYEVLGCDDVECHLPLSSTPNVDEFVGFSSFAHLTMITCEGQWDRINRDYSNRRIVRARLVAITGGQGAPQPILAEPLPYSSWIFTADAPNLVRPN